MRSPVKRLCVVVCLVLVALSAPVGAQTEPQAAPAAAADQVSPQAIVIGVAAAAAVAFVALDAWNGWPVLGPAIAAITEWISPPPPDPRPYFARIGAIVGAVMAPIALRLRDGAIEG